MGGDNLGSASFYSTQKSYDRDLVECDKDEGLAKQAEVNFVDTAVFVSEKQQQNNLRKKGEDIEANVIVTNGQVEHVEVHREVVP